MPDNNPGRGAGLTVLFDVPGYSAKFQVDVKRWDTRLDGQTRARRGRGSGVFADARWLFSSGNISLGCKLPEDFSYPAPDAWKGQTGTIRITIARGRYITYAVQVLAAGYDFDEKKHGSPNATFACRITGLPTYTGFKGTQPTATDPSKADQIQWEGSSKSVDPKGIQSSCTRFIDIWGTLTDTDAAEQTKLLAVISAAAPPITTPHNAKLRSSTFARDAIDGGTITEIWGLTDTKEDVENAGTSTRTDPGGIGNSATITLVNATPSTPAGLTDRGTTISEINDSNDRRQKDAGVRSLTEDVTQPGTLTDDDQSNLADNATVTLVTSTSAQPGTPTVTGQILISIESQQFQSTPEKWRHTFKYGNTTNAQRLTFPASPISDDPSDLNDEYQTSQLNGSSTPPTTPTTGISGTKIRRILSVRQSGTPEQWQHTWFFARTNTEDDIEMPATVTGSDLSHLRDSATICQVTSSGTAPSVPAAPVGQHVKTTTTQLHDTRWKHVFEYANNTSVQDVEFPGNVREDDSSELEDVETTREVSISSAAGAPIPATLDNVVFRKAVSVRIGGTPEKWQHTWHWGVRSTEDDVTFPGTTTDDDQSDLIDEKRITIVDNDIPTPPSTPSGFKLVNIYQEQLTVAGKWKWRYEYKRRTNAEAVEMDGSLLDDDPSDLADKQTITQIQSTSVATATPPGTPSGLVLRDKSSVQIHGASTGAKWKNTYEYTRRTHAEDITFPGTITTDDQSDIADTASITIIDDVTPVAPGTPTGMKLVDIRQEQLTDAGQYQWTYGYARRTRQEAIEFDNSEVSDDASNIADTQTRVLIQALATTGDTVGVPTGLKLVDTISVQIHGASTGAKWKNTYVYQRRTRQEGIEFDGSEITDDASDLADTQIRVIVQALATTGDPTAAPTGLKLYETTSKQIHDASTGAKFRNTYIYKRNNRKDEVEFDVTRYITDEEALESSAIIGTITTTTAKPSNPGGNPTDTKLVEWTYKQIHNAATPKYLHIFKYAARSTQEEIEWLQSRAIVEAGHLDREPITVEVTSSSTPGSGTNPDSTNLSLYRTLSHRVTDTQYVHVFEWKPLTATERLDAEHTLITVDPGTIPLGTEEMQCIIDTNAAAPVAPSASSSGMVCFKNTTRQVGKLKYLHAYFYKYRSSEDELIAEKFTAMTDSSGLTSDSVTAVVYDIGSPPLDPTNSPYSLVERRDFQTSNPTYKLRVYRWGLVTNAEKIELPATKASADPFGENERTTASIVTIASTLSAAGHADALYTANKTVSTFLGVDVVKLTATKALQILRYGGGNKTLMPGGNHVVTQEVRGVPATAITSGAYLPGNISTADPESWIYIFFNSGALRTRRLTIQRALGRFRFRRIFNLADIITVQFLALRGRANNADFLGYSAGEVVYAGPSAAYSFL